VSNRFPFFIANLDGPIKFMNRFLVLLLKNFDDGFGSIRDEVGFVSAEQVNFHCGNRNGIDFFSQNGLSFAHIVG
jgi:hypothetical protein